MKTDVRIREPGKNESLLKFDKNICEHRANL